MISDYVKAGVFLDLFVLIFGLKSLMSLNKKKKTDHIKLPDNWVAVPSKSHPNRTYYYNKVTKKTTWESPLKDLQKEENSTKSHPNGVSSARSKKRKSMDDFETNPQESSSDNVLNIDKSTTTKSADNQNIKNRIRAFKSFKIAKRTLPSLSTKSSSETALQDTKKTNDIALGALGEKQNLRSGNRKDHEGGIVEKHGVPITTEKTKIIRGVNSKDKVSAQSRLIGKRKQFEVAAHKALSSLSLDKTNLLLELERQETAKIVHNGERKINSFNDASSDSHSTTATTRASESSPYSHSSGRRYLRKFKDKTDQLNNNDNLSLAKSGSMCFDEEMDWESSEQEVMIEHIKTLRRNLGVAEELSNDIALCSNTDMEMKENENNFILVFDTNIFISCLPFIKDIRDTCVPELGLPKIFIPWRVLQELDHLKKSDIQPLQVSAVRAIRFINENFSSRHPRVCGQSFEEFTSITINSNSCPDDEILEICLNLRRKDPSKALILITNDKNLESKSIISGIEAFSKDRFMKEKINCSSQRVSNVNDDSKHRNISLKSDVAYCRLKGALKRFFEQLLETEFMTVFSNDWKKIVKKKPPWVLMDLFECLIKHWRAVFTFIFKSDVLDLIKDLKEQFAKVEKGENVIIANIAQISEDLLTKMRGFISEEKPYSKILSDTIKEVEMWVETKKPPVVEETEESGGVVPLSQLPSSSPTIYNSQSPMFDAALCKNKVKSLFQIIWDQINNFCRRISELTSTNGINRNPDAVNEVKAQFPHVIQNVRELVEIVEKILSLGPEDASQANQIILHFANFLVGLNVFQIDTNELNNLPSYIGLFCSDNDGRMLLCTLVNDLKQFAMGMINGMEVLQRI